MRETFTLVHRRQVVVAEKASAVLFGSAQALVRLSHVQKV